MEEHSLSGTGGNQRRAPSACLIYQLASQVQSKVGWASFSLAFMFQRVSDQLILPVGL